MQKISVLSVYRRKSFEDFFARRLNENDKSKAVTLATFFGLKIRQTRIAFLLPLECSRSASLLLSRTTASPASWLPAAILDSNSDVDRLHSNSNRKANRFSLTFKLSQ